jgi:hypothetical protein
MASDLAEAVDQILPFAKRTLEEVLEGDADLLAAVVRKLYELIVEIATFICGYAKQSRACETIFLGCTTLFDEPSSPNAEVGHTSRRPFEDEEPTRQVLSAGERFRQGCRR